jgi:hypothetical protein
MTPGRLNLCTRLLALMAVCLITATLSAQRTVVQTSVRGQGGNPGTDDEDR